DEAKLSQQTNPAMGNNNIAGVTTIIAKNVNIAKNTIENQTKESPTSINEENEDKTASEKSESSYMINEPSDTDSENQNVPDNLIETKKDIKKDLLVIPEKDESGDSIESLKGPNEKQINEKIESPKKEDTKLSKSDSNRQS
ncbi:MAG: hypothetical protein MHPSP_003688, partial [Paramarteilia canceri]